MSAPENTKSTVGVRESGNESPALLSAVSRRTGDPTEAEESPSAVTKALRDFCAGLLQEGEVDVVVGFERGSLPLRSTPVFARTPDDASRLIFDATCENNLSVFVPKLKDKRIAVVVKGCDSRSLNQYILERQVEKGRLYLIGVRCEGVIDRKKLDAFLGSRRLLAARLQENGLPEGCGHYPEGGPAQPGRGVSVSGGGVQWHLEGDDADGRPWAASLNFEDLLCDCCKVCVRKGPVHADVVIGENGQATEGPEREPSFDDVKAIEEVSVDERWEAFRSEVSKCIRCYACRQACPGCYCKECFVDRSAPRWIGGSDDETDTMVFHLMRAMHLAGRCIDCGACVRACPMGVDLGLLNRKLQKDAWYLFHHLAGFEREGKPLFATFLPDDPNDFIL